MLTFLIRHNHLKLNLMRLCNLHKAQPLAPIRVHGQELLFFNEKKNNKGHKSVFSVLGNSPFTEEY